MANNLLMFVRHLYRFVELATKKVCYRCCHARAYCFIRGLINFRMKRKGGEASEGFNTEIGSIYKPDQPRLAVTLPMARAIESPQRQNDIKVKNLKLCHET